MKIRSQNILVFCIILSFAAMVYVWFYPLNKGTLSISSNIDSYSVIVDDMDFDCVKNPCELSLKSGFYNIEITKDKYISQSVSVNVLRGKTIALPIIIKKNPTLVISSIVPSDDEVVQKILPETVQALSYSYPIWSPSGDMLAFIDKIDDKLKISDINGDIKIITSLKNIGESFNLHWSPDNKYLLGIEESDIYFIDIQKTARKKITIGFAPVNITWSPHESYLLANDDENGLYKIDFVKKDVEPIVTTLPLNHAVWENEGRLIFFVYDDKQKATIIKSFDVTPAQENDILIKNNFPVEEIMMDKDGNIYFYNSDENTWYTLNY